MYKQVFIYVCLMLLAACSTAPYHDPSMPAAKTSKIAVDLTDTHKVKQVLNQQHKDWRLVKHRLGGLSKKGIDCSGLVYQTYRTKFGLQMPRSTTHQSKLGRSIRQSQLRAGDLVFFKTGISSRHVGMYIDKGDFLHVSTSKGVKISNLKDPYWRSAYWKAQRVQN